MTDLLLSSLHLSEILQEFVAGQKCIVPENESPTLNKVRLCDPPRFVFIYFGVVIAMAL